MKKSIILLLAIASMCWTIPKPMETIENYNVLLIHGAYASDKCFDLLTNNYKLTTTN